jgi:hypothetical protein
LGAKPRLNIMRRKVKPNVINCFFQNALWFLSLTLGEKGLVEAFMNWKSRGLEGEISVG